MLVTALECEARVDLSERLAKVKPETERAAIFKHHLQCALRNASSSFHNLKIACETFISIHEPDFFEVSIADSVCSIIDLEA